MSAWKADALPLGDARELCHSTARLKAGQADDKGGTIGLFTLLKQGHSQLITLLGHLTDIDTLPSILLVE
jgi:hypothetical protein